MQHATLLDVYIDAFRRRSAAMAGPNGRLIEEAGVVGVADEADPHRGRLLVLNDAAAPALPELAIGAQVVCVGEAAPRCDQLLAADPAFASMGGATAMVCADLAAIPDMELPAGLQLRRVRRLPQDDCDGVAVEAAAAACLRAEGVEGEALDDFVGYLRSLPPEAQLYAALDADAEVRATAASGCFGADVNAFFVSTDQRWRGRGVATAMTAIALRDSFGRGGRLACLDASEAGRHIYERLGFVPAGALTMFMRAG
jgi:GNAT superfamily N-acetyltransferase